MAKAAQVVLRVEGMPELMANLRHQMAEILRDEAEGEPEFVRVRLLHAAAVFETGIEEPEP